MDEIIPENENDKILREKFKKWKNVYPGKVLRADTLLSKAESNTLSDLEYEELNHLLGDPMIWYYAMSNERKHNRDDSSPYSPDEYEDGSIFIGNHNNEIVIGENNRVSGDKMHKGDKEDSPLGGYADPSGSGSVELDRDMKFAQDSPYASLNWLNLNNLILI